MAQLLTSTVTLEPQPNHPFHVLAKKYTTSTSEQNTHGYTFILLHSIGSHKEVFDILAQKWFDMSEASHDATKQIRDIYSIEIPNHGESALVNEEIIMKDFRDEWPLSLVSNTIHTFLTAGSEKGACVDFSKRRMVAVGHSIGIAAVFAMFDYSPKINWEAIFAVEPGFSSYDHPLYPARAMALIGWTYLQPDVWSSREAAKKSLQRSPVHKTWDPRQLDKYVKYGLRVHPASKNPIPFRFSGITTAVSKQLEAACYMSKGLVEEALEGYTRMCNELPVHIILGNIITDDLKELQKLFWDKDAGRNPASVTYIKGAAHAALQQKPEEIAKVIFEILDGSATPSKSKL